VASSWFFILQLYLFIYYSPQNICICRFELPCIGNQSELHTCLYELFFFLTMPYSITSQNTELFSWITLCIRRIKSKVSKATRPNGWATKLSGCQDIRAHQPSIRYVISVNTERLIQRPLRYTRRLGLWPACWLHLITTNASFRKANRFLKCDWGWGGG